ncbi:MAG: hypothetical protein BWY09_00317 [Candidatus Hydrogenedentes bacterium ADurb.Bin179]|nr:MAG: hypothetical protein BWY09_00317 [Candidatus Hydrogenedentes bacterium ADurb.Bin179]
MKLPRVYGERRSLIYRRILRRKGGVMQRTKQVRDNKVQFALRIAFQFLADFHEAPVAEPLFQLPRFKSARGNLPHYGLHLKTRIGHAPGQQGFRPRFRQRHGRNGNVSLSAPGVKTRFQRIHLDEGTLKTIALHLLHALLYGKAFKRPVAGAGSGKHRAIGDHFRLYERGLVQHIITVRVIPGHLNRHHVCARLQLRGDIPFINAVIAVRAPGRTMAHEGAVYKDAVQGRSGDPHLYRRRFRALKNTPKPREHIHLRFAAFQPDRPCHGKHRSACPGTNQYRHSGQGVYHVRLLSTGLF